MKHGERTRERILEAALRNWPNISANEIARELHIVKGVIHYHFKNNAQLRQRAAELAVTRGVARVIVQLIAEKNPAVAGLGEADRARYWRECEAG